MAGGLSGIVVGLAAGAVMLVWQMVMGDLADAPTAVPFIETSAASTPNAVTSFFFGLERFGDDYRWPTPIGAAIFLAVSAAVGSGMLAALGLVFGVRLKPVTGLAVGALIGLALKVVMLDVVADGIQDVNTVSTATPQWSWWAAFALYGGIVGALGGLLTRGARAQASP